MTRVEKFCYASLVIVVMLFLGLGFLSLNTRKIDLAYKTVSLKNIKGLNDCQMFAIESDATKLYVIRCPNSDVSVRWTTADSVDHFTNTIITKPL